MTAAIAAVTQSDRLVSAGLATVVLGFVIWGFACGTAVLWGAGETIRESGVRPFLKDCVSNPAVMLVGLAEILLYCLFGFGGLWLLLKMIARTIT